MKTELIRANAHLQLGNIILYPTDTIWGIGCDATNNNSVKKIYEIKRRNDSKSMLVLVSGLKMLSLYVKNIPQQAVELIEKTRKPLTIIYPEAYNLAHNLLAADGSVGIRITTDSFCKALIKSFGKPIVSTSANISGNSYPTNFQEVSQEIIHSVDCVVNWRQNELSSGLPSQIVKIEANGELLILRK